jgi:hypothetical protein
MNGMVMGIKDRRGEFSCAHCPHCGSFGSLDTEDLLDEERHCKISTFDRKGIPIMS